MNAMTDKMTWQEVAQKWRKGEIVWSAELGGLGPSYEQCIQILLFEILSEWPDSAPPVAKNGEYPEDFSAHVERVVTKHDKKLGFSGAQVGAAKETAYQFMVYGYDEMMSKLPVERRIQVQKWFPRIEG